MLTIFTGLVFSALGAWGMYVWCGDLLTFLRGIGPLGFFFGGITAIIIGLSQINSSEKK